ncbi:hypothetical protein PM082_021924 [Marasmius tenuissimus]|nr:hypothetical protein PM082_021924 [Marasmius tenuissimus]
MAELVTGSNCYVPVHPRYFNWKVVSLSHTGAAKSHCLHFSLNKKTSWHFRRITAVIIIVNMSRDMCHSRQWLRLTGEGPRSTFLHIIGKEGYKHLVSKFLYLCVSFRRWAHPVQIGVNCVWYK